MKIVIDVDALEKDGVLDEPTARLLRTHAMRQTGSGAINILLALGAVAVAAGILTLVPSAAIAALIGLGFMLLGLLILKAHGRQWDRLAGIWVVVGALMLAGSVATLIHQPFMSSLAVALILTVAGVIAESRLLVALVPFALAAAIGGSTGYWHACYELCIEEPTFTVLLFSALAFAAWKAAGKLTGIRHDLTIIFARVCVILVNFGFWIGSLWGDTPGHTFGGGQHWSSPEDRQIPAIAFAIAWGVAIVLAGIWGAKNNRRFMVNTAAVFAAIHLYTQWFEHLGFYPVPVILAGLMAIALGLGFWRYNRAALGEAEPSAALK